jgi:hypothetical protein
MTILLRLGTSLFLVVFLLFGGAVLARCCLGIDCGPEALSALARAQDDQERLDRRMRVHQERNTAKLRITQDVLARRLTLLQAADAFRRVHEETRHDFDPLGKGWAEDLSDETMCFSVLCWTQGAASDDPDRLAVLCDLHTTFVAHFRHAPPGLTVPDSRSVGHDVTPDVRSATITPPPARPWFATCRGKGDRPCPPKRPTASWNAIAPTWSA